MGAKSTLRLIGSRPMPPAGLFDMSPYGGFMPAPELWDWVMANIISNQGPLHNPDHAHLEFAHMGFLWADSGFQKQGRKVIGQAEIPSFMAGGWKRARQEMQFYEWFQAIPDFVITLDGQHCFNCSDIEFAALVEHELYHCAQAKDAFGAPKFKRDTGLPSFTMQGHDVEEFVGVVRRYGIGQEDVKLAALVEAAKHGPEISGAEIARLCGTCVTRAA